MKAADFQRELSAIQAVVPTRRWLYADLLRACAVAHNLPVQVLVGVPRTQHLSLIRRRCWWIGRDEIGLSFAQIGLCWRRDHTSILHGVRVYKKIAGSEFEIIAREKIKDIATEIADGRTDPEGCDDQPQ